MTNAILIVARNNKHLTAGTIRTALSQTVHTDVAVINNASTDGTREWLRGRATNESRLFWWEYPAQKSLSYCWNAGLRRAFLKTDRVLVLNNDVEIAPHTFEQLHWWASKHDREFITAVSVNDRLQLRQTVPHNSSPHPDFSCFMITKRCFELTGDFDEAYYPAWFEDNDYHVRMHRAGIEAVSIDLPYLHHSSSTLKNANPAEQESLRSGFLDNRERFKAQYGCYPDSTSYADLFSKPTLRKRK